jgi:hypothetical protein
MKSVVRENLPLWCVVAVLASAARLAPVAWAGPPFLTDDPEPVALEHWEFYGASQWEWERDAASGTLPHVEVNYGALTGLQLHVIVPSVLSRDGGEPDRYGLGEVELGVKYRFLEARGWQVGIFPLVTLPTGSEERGLGAGSVQALLPVWLQRTCGRWTPYGGGGLRLARGSDAAVIGWLVQRALYDTVAVGVETYVTVPFGGDPIQTQLNAGVVADLSERHHLLLSAGPSFGTDARAQAYLGYLLTW